MWEYEPYLVVRGILGENFLRLVEATGNKPFRTRHNSRATLDVEKRIWIGHNIIPSYIACPASSPVIKPGNKKLIQQNKEKNDDR
jgi:hypothetical protein